MVEILILSLIFIFGAAIGSFLNVLAERLSREESIRGRSRCDHCGAVLGWRDLIPIFSFLFLRGRCRVCKKKLSWQYPIVELATGTLFAVVFLYFNNLSFSLLFKGGGLEWSEFSYYWLVAIGYWLFLICCFIVIFIADLKYFIIPDQMIIAGVVGTLLYKLFGILDFGHWDLFGNWKLEIGNWQTLGFQLLTAIVASAFFLLIVFITRGRGMGLGDVKLAFLMGLILGWPLILPSLFLAFTLGAIVGVILILARKAKMKSAIPFGPFLVVGAFIALFFGQWILDWYFPLAP